MPQLVKGGKWVFGWVIVGPQREILIPPEARREYGFRHDEPLLFLHGSRRSGGFSIGRVEKLEQNEVPLHLRAFGQDKMGPDGQIGIPSDIGVRLGDRLLAVRGSSMALSLLTRGPIFELALKHPEVETFGERMSEAKE